MKKQGVAFMTRSDLVMGAWALCLVLGLIYNGVNSLCTTSDLFMKTKKKDLRAVHV